MSMSHVEHAPVGTQTSGADEAFAHRVERYEYLGFSGPGAHALASSIQIETTGGKDKNSKKLTWETPLNWQRVQKALNSGKCDHALALKIFDTTGTYGDDF
jgi:hypothetical protein